MRKTFSIVALLAALIQNVSAHVGSPDVFFEGRAGKIPISVIVPAPAAFPGVTRVSLLVNDAAVQSVSLHTTLWPASNGDAAPPVKAVRVVGETNLWNAEVWLLRPGLYTFRVNAHTAETSGDTTFPANIVPRGGQPMSPTLRVLLTIGALALMALTVGMASAFARDIRLRDGRAGWCVFAVLLIAVGALGMRWRNMDAIYRNRSLSKPDELRAAVRFDDSHTTVELHPGDDSPSKSWSALAPDHGKLMHLFLIRQPGCDTLAHLHPTRFDSRTFTFDAPPLPGGDYELYGEITLQNGLSKSLLGKVTLPPPTSAMLEQLPVMTNAAGEAWCDSPSALMTNTTAGARDMDDSWHVEKDASTTANSRAGLGLSARLMGGHSMLFENAAAVAAGRESAMRFALFDPKGHEATLQPYMGMTGHALVRHADGSVLAHLHPMGNFSMATLDILRGGKESRDTPATPRSETNRVAFPYQFPKRGEYRVWIQVRIAGRVLTGVFDVNVSK